MRHLRALPLLLIVLLQGDGPAAAAPYFRLIDPAKPVRVAGAYVDPSSPGQTSYGTAVALVTHATADGCLMPTIVCEDWSPAMAGFSYNAGRFQFNIGPAINLAPIAKAALLRALGVVTREDQLVGLKSTLGSEPIVRGASGDLRVSFGPALNVAPVEHGVVLPLSQWKGRARIFAGAELKF